VCVPRGPRSHRSGERLYAGSPAPCAADGRANARGCRR
jgi:hypothetical protein